MELITTHLNADFDGLASMIAAQKLHPGATLAFPGGAQEPVRRFLAKHDLGMAKLKEIDPARISRLILVDVQEPDRIGPFAPVFHNPNVQVLVYDHHPNHTQEVESQSLSPRIQLITDTVGASTTILIEQLQGHNITLSPFEATVLAIGLYEETGSLSYVSTTPRDLMAGAFLIQAGADLNLVADTLKHHLVPEQVMLLNELLLSSDTLYLDGRKVLLAASTYDQYKGDLAEVVQQLGEMEGYDAIIAAMAMEEKVQIIARSRQPNIDVGRLAEAFGGGGHPQAASATIKGRTVVEVKEQLRDYLLHAHRPLLHARDVMTTPVKTIKESATAREAEQRMTHLGVNVLPVLTETGRYQGYLTRETLQKALFHKFHQSPVRMIMDTDMYTATPDTPFHEIQSRMLEQNQRFVPILKGKRIVGVITRTDLLRTLHYDIVDKAQAPSKGQAPPPFTRHRNLRSHLKERLPRQVYTLLQEAGSLAERTHVSVYAVGGFVRDLLLAASNLDIDLVVEGDGIAFARTFARRQQARITIHERFGTSTMLFSDGFKLDIATARTEYYEFPTSLPTVEQSSIKKDLYRRDFTINTLAIRLNSSRFGELVDFFGGQRDLNAKTIRVLHSLSFIEDPTRVFRAIRFEQRLGFRLGKETSALIKGAVRMELFHRLSKSRLFDELVLLLSEKEPRKVLARMAECDLLQFLHPQLHWSPDLASLLKSVEEALEWHRLLFLDRPMTSWTAYFMALMDTLPRKAAGDTVSRLGIPQRHAKILAWVGRPLSQVLRRLSKCSPGKASETYRVLCDIPDEVLVFGIAKAGSEGIKRQVSAFLTTYIHVKPGLTGTDLKAMGLKPGPLFKTILDRLMNARLDGEVQSKSDEIMLAQRFMKREAGVTRP